MVISRDQDRFEAKDLPPGRYRVQGVAGDNQSQWFSNVNVTSGGEDAKVGLLLNEGRGPDLAPAWPQRVSEEQVDKTPKDESGLPEGPGRQLVAERCVSCHDLQRVLVKRSDEDDWSHTVARMRTRMTVAGIPDLTAAENKEVVDYLSQRFPLVQPYDANNRLPHTVLTGKAVNYWAVSYDLANHHAEPHDVAVDPKGGSPNAPASSGTSMPRRSSSPRSRRRPARPQPIARASAIRRSAPMACCGCRTAPTGAG
jgi:hypothetical protein